MGGIIALLVVLEIFLIIVGGVRAQDEKEQREQWKANDERRKFQEKQRRTMGTNYSPDTMGFGCFTNEELNNLNQDFEQ